MKKPRLGFSRDIYEILEEHGPMAYSKIRWHLIEQGSEMKPKQTRHAISNLCQRGYVERSRKHHRRFEIIKTHDMGLEMPDPIQTPSPMKKTPERAQIEPYEALSNAGWREVALVAAIAAISAALTTIILEYL